MEAALNAEGLLADQERALAVAAEEAVAARALAEDRYARGLADLIALLESQRRAFDAESRLLAVRRQRLDTRIDLHLALGGGFTLASQTQTRRAQSSRRAARGDSAMMRVFKIILPVLIFARRVFKIILPVLILARRVFKIVLPVLILALGFGAYQLLASMREPPSASLAPMTARSSKPSPLRCNRSR